MSRKSRPSFVCMALLAASAVGIAAAPTEAAAQASGCGDLQGMLIQRKTIAASLQPKSKGAKMDAKVACTGFTKLVQNGTTLIKWAESNKAWCQIPDSFVESVKADHGKAEAIRTKACGFAAKQIQMEKQARQGGPAAGGLLGGGGLTGSTSLPQGAL